jgi:nicotinamidase-related amidase
MTTAKITHEEDQTPAPTALLLVDVINHMEFPEGGELLRSALPMAHALHRLKQRARQAGIPCIYANDNFGRWRSDFRQIVDRALSARGRPVVELLQPDDDDYFVLKPQHSGFYGTVLDLLLRHLGSRTLIVGGMAANMCVLATATDAYMRGFRLVVPSDVVASERPEQTRSTLAHIADVLKADTRPSAELDLEALVAPLPDAQQRT